MWPQARRREMFMLLTSLNCLVYTRLAECLKKCVNSSKAVCACVCVCTFKCVSVYRFDNKKKETQRVISYIVWVDTKSNMVWVCVCSANHFVYSESLLFTKTRRDKKPVLSPRSSLSVSAFSICMCPMLFSQWAKPYAPVATWLPLHRELNVDKCLFKALNKSPSGVMDRALAP